MHEWSLARTRPTDRILTGPMQYDTGRPNSVIRLRISQSRTTSLPGPAGLRARRPSPMTDARLAPPARPPAPESAVACRSGGFQARLGPCVPWKPPDIDPIGHPHVVFRVDWTTPDDPARSRVIPRRTGYQHVWSASAEGAQPLGMEPRSGPARARVRPRRPALLSRVTRSLAGSYPVAWTRATAHRRAVSGSRRLEVGRWCADAGRPTRFKPSSPSPTDAVRDGSAKLGHPVQNVTREHGLTPLPR